MKLLLLVTLLTAGATAHSISRRAVKRYGNAFDCFYDSDLSTVEREPERSFVSRTFHPLLVYRLFGCMCQGLRRLATYEVDTVSCCLEHETCYNEAKKLGGCKISEDNPYDIPYYYSCSGRELTCSDKNNACQAAICNCDRQAAICIFREMSDNAFQDFGYNRFC